MPNQKPCFFKVLGPDRYCCTNCGEIHKDSFQARRCCLPAKMSKQSERQLLKDANKIIMASAPPKPRQIRLPQDTDCKKHTRKRVEKKSEIDALRLEYAKAMFSLSTIHTTDFTEREELRRFLADLGINPDGTAKRSQNALSKISRAYQLRDWPALHESCMELAREQAGVKVESIFRGLIELLETECAKAEPFSTGNERINLSLSLADLHNPAFLSGLAAELNREMRKGEK